MELVYIATMWQMSLKSNWKLFLIASLTLGLAPFNPPHILGKIQWVLGVNVFSAENGMQGENWFDVLLHGLPWVLLLTAILLNIFGLLTKKDSQ
ncbi:MAG: hypothetical protein ACI9JT_002461 [Polaribacter sp.]